MLVAELLFSFQILLGYILIRSNSEFQRRSAQPWPISPTQGLSLQVLPGEFKKPQTKPSVCSNELQIQVQCYKRQVLFLGGADWESFWSWESLTKIVEDILLRWPPRYLLPSQAIPNCQKSSFFVVAVDFKGWGEEGIFLQAKKGSWRFTHVFSGSTLNPHVYIWKHSLLVLDMTIMKLSSLLYKKIKSNGRESVHRANSEFSPAFFLDLRNYDG